MIDTHSHLTFNDYSGDLEQVIKNAVDSNITKILNIFLIPDDCGKLALFSGHDFIYSAAGIHPEEILKQKNITGLLDTLRSVLINPGSKFIALGEIGLDYYHLPDIEQEKNKLLQKELFKKQLALASELKLPVIIHCRDAWNDMLDILNTVKFPYSGILHCFSGDSEIMNKCIDSGFYISVAGPVTYPKAIKLREIVAEIPLNKLLIETDCPFLSPQPVRGKRNEPSYIKYTYEQIAQIKNIPVSRLETLVESNFLELLTK